jgi:GDP-L-fucose synthase
MREFIYVDDLADALVFLMQNYQAHDIINVGSMQEITIADLAHKIADVVGYQGKINLDTSKPDGAPRKCLDSGKLFAMGWQPKVLLEDGLRLMYGYHFVEDAMATG